MATATRTRNLNWHGDLTIANAADIGRLLRELLTDKRFTVVTYSPDRPHSRPMVLTSETLKDKGVTVTTEPMESGTPWGHVMISTDYGVFGFSTLEPENEHKREGNTPYLAFEWNQVTIEHKAPCGDALRWIFKQESDAD